MASQVEEVVADAGPRDPQHLDPEGRELLFDGGPRRHVPGGGGHRLRGRERPAVNLAAAPEGELRQDHEGRRDHRLRQPFAQEGAHLARLRARAGGGHQIGDQLEPAARPVAGDHHRLPHVRTGQERRLDLPGLDADTAYLDLEVKAAQELDLPSRQPARQVAGPVQTGARLGGEWVGDEARRRQVGACQITAGRRHAADAQLAGNAHRGGLTPFVQQRDVDVVDGPADGDRPLVLPRRAAPGGDVDRRLGGAIEVLEPGGGQSLPAAAGQRHRQSLAAADHQAQRGAAGKVRLVEEELEQRGDEMQDGDPLAADQIAQVGRIPVPSGHRQGEASPHQGGPEKLPDRDVEAVRRLLEHPVLGCQPVGRLHPEQPVRDGAMGVHDPLRPAGRARAEEDVGQIVGLHGRAGIRRALPGDLVAVAVEIDHAVAGGRVGDQPLLGQQHGDPGLGCDQGEALHRRVGVEGEVGGPGLENAEEPRHQLQRAFGAEAHHRARQHARLPQMAGDLVGPAVELAVGQPFGAADRRHRPGRPCRLARQEGVQELRWPLGVRVVPLGDDLMPLALAEEREIVAAPVGSGQGVLQ